MVDEEHAQLLRRRCKPLQACIGEQTKLEASKVEIQQRDDRVERCEDDAKHPDIENRGLTIPLPKDNGKETAYPDCGDYWKKDIERVELPVDKQYPDRAYAQ
jgi:hypothetical protein